MTSAKLIIILLFVVVAFTYAQYYDGDRCHLEDSRQRGTCVMIDRCPYAIRKLRRNIKPQTCGFVGSRPIVCCPHGHGSDNLASTEEPIKETTIPIVPITKSAPVRKSIEKCQEYFKKKKDLGFHTFVVGGKKSLAKEFPHMAILGYGDENSIQWLCGGTLISENFVLTAAHCVYSQEFGQVGWVRVGDLDIKNTTDDAKPQNFKVSEAIVHPEYAPPSQYNDIALLRLDHSAEFDDYVKPGCLETERDITEGTVLTATGWGKVDYAGESSSHLMEVELRYVDNSRCSKTYQGISRRKLSNGIVDDSQVCAGDQEGKDTCGGDSGGPLQVPDLNPTSHHKIVGITSFGKACGLTASAGVYTRISHYLDWIESIVWPDS